MAHREQHQKPDHRRKDTEGTNKEAKKVRPKRFFPSRAAEIREGKAHCVHMGALKKFKTLEQSADFKIYCKKAFMKQDKTQVYL